MKYVADVENRPEGIVTQPGADGFLAVTEVPPDDIGNNSLPPVGRSEVLVQPRVQSLVPLKPVGHGLDLLEPKDGLHGFARRHETNLTFTDAGANELAEPRRICWVSC